MDERPREMIPLTDKSVDSYDDNTDIGTHLPINNYEGTKCTDSALQCTEEKLNDTHVTRSTSCDGHMLQDGDSQPEVVCQGNCDSCDNVKERPLAEKIFRTFAIDAAYFCAALHLGIIGPSQLDLEALTNTNTSQISTVYTVRSVMAIIGSLVLGPILDKFNRYVVVWLSLICSSAFTIAGPWSRSLTGVLLTLGPPEFFGCALGMGTHLLCVDLWGAHSGPYLQLLNFVSITGFTIAPLLVKPFLTETGHHSSGQGVNDTADYMYSVTSNKTGHGHNVIIQNSGVLNESIMSLNISVPGVETEPDYVIYLAYLIVGIYGLVISLLFTYIITKDNGYYDCFHRFVFYFRKCMDHIRNREKISHYDDKESKEFKKTEDVKPIHNFSNSQLYLMYFLFFWMILFYGGIEVSYPSQVTTFVSKNLHWKKSTGASLASIVMGSNAVFTALGIYLSKKIRPIILIWIDVIVLFISLLMLTLLIESHPQAIWICSALIGAGSATIMPCAYTWANDLFEISWLFNSAFWCGFFSGFMISNLTGFLMHSLGYMWYCYTLLICSIMVIAMFTALTFIATRCNKTRSGKSSSKDLANDR